MKHRLILISLTLVSMFFIASLYALRWTAPNYLGTQEESQLKEVLEAKQRELQNLYVRLEQKQDKPTEAASTLKDIQKIQDDIDKLYGELSRPAEKP